jgi:hypothetical protein
MMDSFGKAMEDANMALDGVLSVCVVSGSIDVGARAHLPL